MLFGKLGQKAADTLAMPKEVSMNLPRIVITGDIGIYICGYKALGDYTEKEVRLTCASGVISVTGERLMIKSIENEEIIINGHILSVNFM